jgi:FtsP/CotA-like multicopper oxidase with cupredoxin domain
MSKSKQAPTMKIHKAAITFLLLLPSGGLSTTAREGLSDPILQPKFTTIVPNPLDPSFIYDTTTGKIEVSVNEGTSNTGLVGLDGVSAVPTPIWGYGTPALGYTWPGRTFVVKENELLDVTWHNKLPIAPGYLLTGIGEYDGRSVVDESFHWAYSLHGYEDYTIEEDGTPISPHVHGGHNDAAFDGNPEFFFSPEFGVKGPQWTHKTYKYDNSQSAGLLWYHDHAMGITRTNVYAGLAGFYVVRDEMDTGKEDNPMNLPAFPYEIPLVVQDKMFKETGELFYAAFKGDPFYKDFITDEKAQVGDDDPTALAEFFGDHMVVNG